MMHFLTMLLVMSIWPLSDRFAGGGDPKLDDVLPGRAAFWGAAAGFIVSVTAGIEMWLALAYSLAWLVWRTPQWKLIPGASSTPVHAHEIMATFVRHAILPAAMVVVALFFHKPLMTHFMVFTVWAAFATLLSAIYGQWKIHAVVGDENGHDPNAWIELTRGLAFGLALWLVAK